MNLDPTIFVAVCGAGASIISTIIGALISSKLTSYRIDQLEKKVEKHNEVVKRTYENEKEIEILKTRNNVSEHRLTDLEGAAHHV